MGLALPLIATLASATPDSALVLSLESTGVVPELAEEIDRALRDEVRKVTGARLLPTPRLDFDSLRLAAGCREDGPACLAAIGRTLDATVVVRSTLTAMAGRATLVLVLVPVAGGGAKGRTMRHELPVFDAYSVEEVRWLAAAALGENRPAPTGEIVVSLFGDERLLREAQVLVDDEPVTAGPLRGVPAGIHRVTVKSSAPVEERTVVVRPGQVATVEIGLSPPLQAAEPPPLPKEVTITPITPPVPPPPPGPSLALTWGFLAGTAAAVAVGVWGFAEILSAEAEVEAACISDGQGRCLRNNPFVDCYVPNSYEACARGERGALITRVAFPIAGVLGAATVGSFFLEGGLEILSPAAPVSVTVAPSGQGAVVQGRF